MSPRTAQKIFIFLVIAAVPLTLWPFWELWTIFSAVQTPKEQISVDEGAFYLWLMSVFFTFYWIQHQGLRKGHSFNTKRASRFIVVHFLVIVVIAYLSPVILKHWLSENHYHLCSQSQDRTTLTRSSTSRYSLNTCD